MLHYARRAVPGTWLFHTWAEAGQLWRAITARVPGLLALTLMPDHLHLLAQARVEEPLAHALRAYALWRNHRCGRSGSVVIPGGPPTVAEGWVKQRRDLRYIALNPCRARLVSDPLAWPMNSHRDAMGLAVPLARPPVDDPEGLHAYVSADPHVHVQGTELPHRRSWGADGPPVEVVLQAVSALTRRTLEELEQRGPARGLLLRATVALCQQPAPELADQLGCSIATLYNARRSRTSADVLLVERVMGDSRFGALDGGDLRVRLRHRPTPPRL